MRNNFKYTISYIKVKVDNRITFTKFIESLKGAQKILKELPVKLKNYGYFYIIRFRNSTAKKIVMTTLISFLFYFYLGTFNLQIFTYEGLLFFSDYSFSFLIHYNGITKVSYNIVVLGLKYFMFFRFFTLVIIYLLINEMRLLPGFYNSERLYLILKGYQSGIFFPFIGPWLLLLNKKDEYYTILLIYKMKKFMHKTKAFIKANLISYVTTFLIWLINILNFYVVFFMLKETFLIIISFPFIQFLVLLLSFLLLFLFFVIKYESKKQA